MVLPASSKRRREFARVLHAIRKSHWLRFLEDQGSDQNKYTGIMVKRFPRFHMLQSARKFLIFCEAMKIVRSIFQSLQNSSLSAILYALALY
jgi:hypothetical protein